MNGANNGINLNLTVHPQGARHPRYNAAVQKLLDNLATRNLTDAQAATEVQAIVDRLLPGLARLNQTGQGKKRCQDPLTGFRHVTML